jgi:hypothetical protein
MEMHENHGENDNEGEGEYHKKEGHLFFGENYEKELNYKLY